MIDENLDYMAIFEDDVYLGNDAACFIKNDWLYFEFDIIKLETQHELVHIGKSIHHHGNRTLNPLKAPMSAPLAILSASQVLSGY